jgi:hypothetical protein
MVMSNYAKLMAMKMIHRRWEFNYLVVFASSAMTSLNI